jgi:hypothetical protein
MDLNDQAQRNSVSLSEGTLCFLAAGILTVLISWRQLPVVARGELINPDSYMRVLRLAEMIRAGKPLDVVARDGSGAGISLHW